MSRSVSVSVAALISGLLLTACGSQDSVNAVLPEGSTESAELLVSPVGGPVAHGYNVARLNNGNFIFSAYYDRALFEIAPDGTTVRSTGLGFRPSGLAVDPDDGDILVLDYTNGRLLRLNADGSPDTDVLTSPITGLVRPIGVLLDGSTYVTVGLLDPIPPNGRLRFFAEDGTELPGLEILEGIYPTGIARVAAGDYVITNYFNPDGLGGLVRYTTVGGESPIALQGFDGRPAGVATRTIAFGATAFTTLFFTSYGDALNEGQLFRVPLTGGFPVAPTLIEDSTSGLSDLDANPYGIFKANGEFECFVTNFFNNNVNEQVAIKQSNECGAYIASALPAASLQELEDGTTPLFRPDPPASVEPGALESNSDVFAFREGNIILSADVTVDAVLPGLYSTPASLPNTQPVIPVGTEVTSYYLHIDRSSGFAATNQDISFSSEILGVQVLDSTLTATDAEAGAPGTTYPLSPGRGLDLNTRDQFRIDVNQRTFGFVDVVNGPVSIDQVRVFLAP